MKCGIQTSLNQALFGHSAATILPKWYATLSPTIDPVHRRIIFDSKGSINDIFCPIILSNVPFGIHFKKPYRI